jgi:hypothetical protein
MGFLDVIGVVEQTPEADHISGIVGRPDVLGGYKIGFPAVVPCTTGGKEGKRGKKQDSVQ